MGTEYNQSVPEDDTIVIWMNFNYAVHFFYDDKLLKHLNAFDRTGKDSTTRLVHI